MNKTLITASMTLAALAAPMLTTAATTPIGFDNCVKAFMQTLPEKIGSSPRLREAKYVDQSPDRPPQYELIMTARSSRTNRLLLTATCRYNSAGEVTAMGDASAWQGQ
jgi:hypothetical protein